MTTTWRKTIGEEMANYGEDWADVEACTLNDAQLDLEFNDGYGHLMGSPFTLWTKRRVYFPAGYDGDEWCASVSRHPSTEVTAHVGGG